MSSSDTDSSSSSSDDSRKRRKLSKKHKQKQQKEKKSKKNKKEKKIKHKRKRRSSSEDLRSVSIPIAPPRDSNLEEIDAFGPALPPHLLKKSEGSKEQIVIGPIMPEEFRKASEKSEDLLKEVHRSPTHHSDHSSDEDLNDCFGPLPSSSKNTLSLQQVELEQRALEMKIAAMDGVPLTSSTDQKVREEWMLELPEVGLKGGLAALSNMKRTFYQGKERPDFSDRSSWTKTPQSEANPEKSKPSSKTMTDEATEKYERERDAEQETIAKKHKKKHKREESLVDIHQKKLRKEQKLKEKELKASGAKPERRPFSRDVDLKLNKIDKNQTKQIVDKAKLLDSKFSGGKSKYL